MDGDKSIDGRAIVIHEKQDFGTDVFDYVFGDENEKGDNVACGTIDGTKMSMETPILCINDPCDSRYDGSEKCDWEE